MPAHLIDKPPYLVLVAPKTAKMKALAAELGGRWTPQGLQLPRLMSIYDKLHQAIPGLNTLCFPSDRGFGLKDVGQAEHPAWSKLRDYQQATVDLLVSSPHPGMLVELSPGLGKSPVSVIAADTLGSANVLIVSVKSLRNNWVREIHTWTSRECHIRFQEEPVPDAWNITNYDTLVTFFKQSQKTGKPSPYARSWDIVILDESVLVKNRKALRTQAIRAIRPKAKKVWCLTGSPTTRYGDDMYSQLNLCSPRAFSSYWRFAKEFCVIEQSVWGDRIIGTKDNIDFEWALRDLVISYNQTDVLDLPPVIHERIDLEMLPEQQKVYDDLLHEFEAELESGVVLTTPNKISRLTRLQQVVSSLANVDGGDYSCKADAVEDMLEAHSVEYPLLIWTHYLIGAHLLYERLLKRGIKVGIATGSETDVEHIIEQYKAGEFDCLILSLMTGRFGHNLIQTRSVIYVDRTFDGDAYYQSLHRIERFGLSHSPVVYTLRVPGSVEELVEENLSGKLETISSITNADLAKMLRSLGRV